MSFAEYSAVSGLDFTLPQPPSLVDAPLSLLTEAKTLTTTQGLTAQKQTLLEQRASLQSATPAEQLAAETSIGDIDLVLADIDTQLKDLQRWEHGFVYLPELGLDALQVWEPDSGVTKQIGNNQTGFVAYDPFVVVGRDDRSTFGWPGTDYQSRALRAFRALTKHEPWECESEFWGGNQIPTNYHLTASPHTATTAAHRSVPAFPNPSAPPGTVLGTAYGLAQSLAALDQAIAESDAGTGMIHASPYVMQQWMKIFSYIRLADGLVRTVNNNILVPGYGYPGTGPDQISRAESDGATTSGSTTLASASLAFTAFDIGRQVTDSAGAIPTTRQFSAVIVAGATSVVSAFAAFTTADEGQPVAGVGLASGTTIATVTSTTVAVLSHDALMSGNGVTVTVGSPTYIVGITSGTEAVLSQPATSAQTGDAVTVSGVGGRATGALQQWAYATEQVFHLEGDVITYPFDLSEMSPDLPVNNNAPVRAERSHAFITNRLLRAAILVDTTTS